MAGTEFGNRVSGVKRAQALIHIGGGYLQSPSIRWAKELGLRVIVTDVNPDAPGRLLADQFEVLDGTDVQALLALARSVNKTFRLAGAYASCDFGLPSVSAIAEEFHLPGCPPDAVQRALDKSLAKEIWRRDGIATPGGAVVEDEAGVLSAAEEIGLPLILKPVHGSGSRGVASVWEQGDLAAAFESAHLFSERVLVEEFVEGRHIDVNGLFIDGRFVPGGTLDRFFCETPYHFPVWGCQPSSLTTTEETDTYELVEKAARSLGIGSGPVKADVIWTGRGPVLLELAPRLHGDVSSAYVAPLAKGASPIRRWLACLAGVRETVDCAPQPGAHVAGWMAIFPEVVGELVRVTGVESALAVQGVREVVVLAKPGRMIREHRDNSSVCGFVWATGASRPELFNALSLARASITFQTRETSR